MSRVERHLSVLLLYFELQPGQVNGYTGLLLQRLETLSLFETVYTVYSVCHTLSRGFLKLALTGPRRLESQRNVTYTFYLRQVKFFSQFKTIFYRQNMNVYLTY